VSDADAAGEPADTGGLYVESTIIMTTVRVVAPFVFTFAFFVMFHGADSPGGGFQGGVVAGATLMMIAFAFGIESTRAWVNSTVVAALAAGGVAVFALVGLGSIVLGGSFLEYNVYPIYHASKYGIELVEFAIGGIVSGVVISLFFVVAAGFDRTAGEGEA
jgi:multicomponent Na+:H+ antiporter subunit B